jgi:hypothetical protein
MTAQRYVPGRLAEASGLHMNLNGRRSRNSREIEPASALHGLPSECALSVLDLHLDASTDLEVPLLSDGRQTYRDLQHLRSPMADP